SGDVEPTDKARSESRSVDCSGGEYTSLTQYASRLTSRGTTTRAAMDSRGRFEGIVEFPFKCTMGSIAGTSVRSSIVVGRRRCVGASTVADGRASNGTRIREIILFCLV